MAAEQWNVAKLQEPVLDKAHTAFRYLWEWKGGEAEIMSRAIDETGYMQPTMKQLKEARGADMGGYHLNPVTSWLVQRDGRVLFKPER